MGTDNTVFIFTGSKSVTWLQVLKISKLAKLSCCFKNHSQQYFTFRQTCFVCGGIASAYMVDEGGFCVCLFFSQAALCIFIFFFFFVLSCLRNNTWIF